LDAENFACKVEQNFLAGIPYRFAASLLIDNTQGPAMESDSAYYFSHSGGKCYTRR